MNQQRQQDGASVNARHNIPSTDLASLINFLVAAFPADKNHPNPVFGWEVLKFEPDKKRLSINTYGILRRFLNQKEMLAAFRNTDHTGFLRDLLIPPKNFDAKMGGRLFNDQTAELAQGINKLKQKIVADLERFELSPDNILVADPASALQQLATQHKIKNFLQEEASLKMVVMAFSKSEADEKEFARVLSATEEVQADNWLKRLSDSMVEMLSNLDDEFDDTQRDKLIETLKQDFEQPNSQVTQFLNFLEDEALARVRLQIGFAIMTSLAAQITSSADTKDQRFVQYVQKVIQLFEYFAVPESEHSLHLNLASDYGLSADFSIAGELVKALFYNCLPVWAESNTQLFESHYADVVKRDVSYRFRINGKNPKKGLPIFETRLQRWQETLLDNSEQDKHKSISKPLAEVVFLWLVLNPAISSANLFQEAQQLEKRLKNRNDIAQLITDLSSWSSAVEGFKHTLITLLRNNSRPVISRVQKSIDELFVVVQQGVVDTTAIERARGKASEPFIKHKRDNRIEWFKYLKVTRNPNDVPNGLFSIQVCTELHDRTLTMRKTDNSALKVTRQVPTQLLNIAWMPLRVDEKQRPIMREPRAKINPAWRMGAGVDIWYDPEQLKYRNKSTPPEEDRRQYRAAAATAMAVVVYAILQVLAKTLSKQADNSLVALMLRFQTQGKEAADNEGDHLVYAITHAIESALMRDIPVRMQGLVTEEKDKFFRDKAAAFALSAAFPMVINAPNLPTINKIAVIIYTTRPCDAHHTIEETGFTFQAKTYLAEAVNSPLTGYQLAFNRMQTHVVENRDAFKNPKLIVEEVARLHDLGYEHIMLISNDFGNRRINRSAQRHSPHTQIDFLDVIAEKFSHVQIYTLRRDVFPATRLHERNNKDESAYEATQLAVHNEFNSVSKQLIPIYTFATLTVVGTDKASRPQSGFCTYFLDTDQRVKNTQWSEQARANLLVNAGGTRECLLQVLRGLHFLEAEKSPDGGVFKPVLDPFAWVNPSTIGSAGEIEAIPSSRRNGKVLLSLPALLSHVTEALHSGRR